MRSNKELAIAIAEALDDGFSSKADFADGVIEIYDALESGNTIYVFNLLNTEIEDRDYVNVKDLTDLFFEVRERL